MPENVLTNGRMRFDDTKEEEEEPCIAAEIARILFLLLCVNSVD